MKRLAAVLVLALGFFPGCGSSSPSTPPVTAPPVSASFSASASPNPIIAQNCTPQICGTSGQRFAALTSVTVTEGGGLGGNVNFINMTLRNTTTGTEVGTLNYSANDIIARSGTNHVNGRGNLTVPNIGAFYTLAFGGREATFTIAVSITDDRGGAHNQVITVPVV